MIHGINGPAGSLDEKIQRNTRAGARPLVAVYLVATPAERAERHATRQDMDDDDIIQLIELLGVDPVDIPTVI